MENPLSFAEARVLGCLMEKATTTPDIYPLTVNSLLSACNQRSNRDPVVEFDELTVKKALDGLREKHLAIRVDQAGSRTAKFRHAIHRVGNFEPSQEALLCLLLLRGPQTVGELRGRSERLRPFATLDEVREQLKSLQEDFDFPLVCELPRQIGRKEVRFTHLLCGEPEIKEEEPGGDTSAPYFPEAKAEVSAEEHRVLEERVEKLEAHLRDLEEKLEAFRREFE
ncbi:MAG: YceH family protein [Opitutales bacterium]|nr:YceH family protein [Opitutales bacterium]